MRIFSKDHTFKIMLAFIAILVCSVSFAQKNFKVTVKWPAGLVTNKMQIFYHNGVKDTVIDAVLSKNEITISDNFVSKYATIAIIVESNNHHMPAYNRFYVSEKPATIIFNSGLNSAKHSRTMYKTTNAYDVSSIDRKFNLYIGSADKEREAYLQSNGMDSIYFSLDRKLILKKLEFIRQNRNSYYAFHVFQYEIAPVTFPKQDSLADTFSDFYKTTFPEDLRNRPEGIKVTKTLESRRVGSHDNIKAPKFVITDISGNKISSDNLKDKYTLINFWATWCGPCVAELPAIRQIREKYSEDKLAIISVSFDRDYEPFSDALKKYKMDWINVYRDEEFVSNFGGRQALPKLFLIDNKGTIIYNRASGKETDYVNLKVLKEILEKELVE